MNQNQSFVVVTGATGHIGGQAIDLLLQRHQSVRAVGRSAAKLKGVAAKGADPFEGSVDDAAAMTRAFTGASAVFAMIPPSYEARDLRAEQNRVVEALAQAIEKASVGHVVALSSIGAGLESDTGPILGLHDFEKRLARLTRTNVLILRPAYFMENLFANIGLIKSNGIAGGALLPDLPGPMIATRDIAAFVADRLQKRDFTGHSVTELLGQRDLSQKEASRVLGAAIGKADLQYVQFTYGDTEKALTGLGFSADAARGMVEMIRSMNEKRIRPTEARSAKNTTPTSIEEFGKIFATAYNAPAPAHA